MFGLFSLPPFLSFLDRDFKAGKRTRYSSIFLAHTTLPCPLRAFLLKINDFRRHRLQLVSQRGAFGIAFLRRAPVVAGMGSGSRSRP